MSGYNKIILIGNVTRELESFVTEGGSTIVNFSVAVNETYTQDNKKKGDVSFIDCKAFNRTAETLKQFVNKGDRILLEGKLKQETWETSEGQKRSKLLMYVFSFMFLSTQKNESNSSSQEPVNLNPNNNVPF